MHFLLMMLLLTFSTHRTVAAVHTEIGVSSTTDAATRNCSAHHSEASCSDAGCGWCSPLYNSNSGWCYNTTTEQCCNGPCASGNNCEASICSIDSKCCPAVSGAPTCCALNSSCCEGICYDGTNSTCCPVANPWDLAGSPAICALDQSCCMAYFSICCAPGAFCCTDDHGNVECCSCNQCNTGICACDEP
jgi:hypothetical protein